MSKIYDRQGYELGEFVYKTGFIHNRDDYEKYNAPVNYYVSRGGKPPYSEPIYTFTIRNDNTIFKTASHSIIVYLGTSNGTDLMAQITYALQDLGQGKGVLILSVSSNVKDVDNVVISTDINNSFFDSTGIMNIYLRGGIDKTNKSIFYYLYYTFDAINHHSEGMTLSDNIVGMTNNLLFNNQTWLLEDYFSIRELDNTSDSNVNGGYGVGEMPHDNIDIPTIPNIPLYEATGALYLLSQANITTLKEWLWTSDWENTIKKIHESPMDNIIKMSCIDCNVSPLKTSNIIIGNVDTNIKASIINNWVKVDCGAINIKEYYGTFADYEPYCATTLYLPKVGFVNIPADIVINNTIKIEYHIDLLSGEGLCYIICTSTRDGFTFVYNTYTCKCTLDIMLSSKDYSNQLVATSNAILKTTSAIAGAIGTSGTTAPLAINTGITSALDVATTKNPTITNGNYGNATQLMSPKKPYLIINRTNLVKPSSFQENNGYLINYTAKIGNHTGFLKTRNFHAEFDAPYSHKVELERLMNEGVFING